MKKSASVVLFSAAKAVVTLSLIAAICIKIDFSALATHFEAGGIGYLVLGTFLLAINNLIVGGRWWLLLRQLNVESLSLAHAFAVTYAAVFVGQVTPGLVGADAVRGWLCYRRRIAWQPILMSLLADRLLGFLALIVVAGAVWFWQFGAADAVVGQRIAAVAALAAALAAVMLWAAPALTRSLARRWPRLRLAHELAAMFRLTMVSPAGICGMALSCVIVALTVNAAILFARGFGVALSPTVAYLVVPVAILFAMLPISIGGWGVREASLSYGLSLFGVAPADAASIGLALGIGMLLAALPGGIVLLLLGEPVGPALRSRDGLAD